MKEMVEAGTVNRRDDVEGIGIIKAVESVEDGAAVRLSFFGKVNGLDSVTLSNETPVWVTRASAQWTRVAD